ncbi:hypothetical protein NLG97_g6080 [Lecanicillium saksenae]|uniref:Uncharacterized protein n=1 Tax=Lecanicillium saksenae TaxID=468837 RepID=A0ACC1QQN1_9HYPO|nr:hypothetical protein NLG97_g6080 [Lecanicillium saksenae]
MKLSNIATALLCAATVEAWGDWRVQRPCETPKNCAVKCKDGAYYNKKMKKKGVYALHCNGTHSDYRWGGMVCTQTLGPSYLLTRTRCGWVNGTVCSKDERARLEAVCVADMELYDVFKLMCSLGKGRWSATADFPDIKNECPGGTHIPTDWHDELTAALSSLEKIAWVRLSDETARFTVIPDMGSQVWAYVSNAAMIAFTTRSIIGQPAELCSTPLTPA